MIIKNGNVLFDDWKFKTCDIGITDDLITENGDGEIIDARDCYVLPGFVDTHIHGCVGASAYMARKGDLNKISEYLCRFGVTSFAPTTATTALDDIIKQLSIIHNEKDSVTGSKVAGIHLEGPFISREKRGALLEKYIQKGDTDIFDSLIDCDGGELVRLITIAPEIEGAEKLIRHAVSRGVKVSMGHSMATVDKANRAVEWGVSQSTHTCNAMRPLDHREVGILGAALNNDKVKCELICDFVHVSPAMCQIIIKLKGTDRVNMISDCEWAAGLEDGEYHDEFGRTQYIRGGMLTLENGTIAGSTKLQLLGVQNLVNYGILPLEDAVKIATINPAKTLGIENETGSIAFGKKADLIILNKDLELLYTIIDGKIAHKA